MEELKKIAKELRKDILLVLNMAGSGHVGGSLSCVEILVSLYFRVMHYDAKHPSDKSRDRFVLSKGHAAPALYATLSKAGFFPRDMLWTLRKLGSPLQGHPDSKYLKGVEASTGSLGHGLPQACGMALAGKLDNNPFRVYCLIGDGEMDEGLVWEASMSASHYKLDNLCVIVDNNGLQIDGRCKDVMNIYPLDEKFRAFGFYTISVDGHKISELLGAFEEAKDNKRSPTVIIAHTIKGKGVSFMEDKVEYHGVAPTDEELKKAIEEVE
jgi:transketolase